MKTFKTSREAKQTVKKKKPRKEGPTHSEHNKEKKK